jgi:hypothetical protein
MLHQRRWKASISCQEAGRAFWCALKGKETLLRVERHRRGIIGINDKGIATDRAPGSMASVHGQAQQQGAKALSLQALITGQPPHPKTGHRIGRQWLGIARLQIGQGDLRESQGVEPCNLCGRFCRDQDESPAHTTSLVGLLFQKATESRFTTKESFAVVTGGVERCSSNTAHARAGLLQCIPQGRIGLKGFGDGGMKGLEILLGQGDLLIALNGFNGTLLGRQAHKRSHGHPFDGSRLGKELLVSSD